MEYRTEIQAITREYAGKHLSDGVDINTRWSVRIVRGKVQDIVIFEMYKHIVNDLFNQKDNEASN